MGVDPGFIQHRHSRRNNDEDDRSEDDRIPVPSLYRSRGARVFTSNSSLAGKSVDIPSVHLTTHRKTHGIELRNPGGIAHCAKSGGIGDHQGPTSNVLILTYSRPTLLRLPKSLVQGYSLRCRLDLGS